MATLQLDRQELIPAGFLKHLLATLVWDNNDFTGDTPSGHGTTHNTNGIIVQRMEHDTPPDVQLVRLPKTKQRSFTSPSQEIEPYYGQKRHGPSVVDRQVTGANPNVLLPYIRMDLGYCLSKLQKSTHANFQGGVGHSSF